MAPPRAATVPAAILAPLEIPLPIPSPLSFPVSFASLRISEKASFASLRALITMARVAMDSRSLRATSVAHELTNDLRLRLTLMVRRSWTAGIRKWCHPAPLTVSVDALALVHLFLIHDFGLDHLT